MISDVKAGRKLAAGHASTHNHLYRDRRLNRRDFFKENRSGAIDEWRKPAAQENRNLVLWRLVRITIEALRRATNRQKRALARRPRLKFLSGI